MNDNYFEMKLPSKGKTYGGVSTIQVRPLVGSDEEFLAESPKDAFELRLYELLANTIKGVPFSDLTFGDAVQVMMWHAVNSFEDEYEVDLICRVCEKQFTHIYHLDDLDVIYLDDDSEVAQTVELSIGKTVTVKLIKAVDVIQKIKRGAEGLPTYLNMIARTVEPLSETDDIEARTEFLRSLPRKDLAKIRDAQDIMYHGPKLESTSACTHCEARWPFTVPFRFQALFEADL